MNRDFKGIWIPKEIWLNQKISIQAKALWAEIHSLYSEEKGGCYASDKYLMEFLGVKSSRLHEVIKELKDAGLLLNISFDGRQRVMLALDPKKEKFDRVSPSGKPKLSLPENRNTPFRKTGKLSYIEIKEEIKEQNNPPTPQGDVAAFFPCLKEIDIPLKDKIFLTRNRTQEAVEHAIKWISQKKEEIRSLPAAIKWASEELPPLPVNQEEISQKNSILSRNLEGQHKTPNGITLTIEALSKQIECYFAGSQGPVTVFTYEDKGFMHKLKDYLERLGLTKMWERCCV